MPFLPWLAALPLLGTPHLGAVRVETPPVLDGKLDDAVWRQAHESDAFTQKRPSGGKTPGERTIVRVLYDADNIYVGVDCIQTKSKVVGRLTRRDRSVEADLVSVAFDSRGDGKTAFDFSVNAAGVLSDGVHYDDTEYSEDWDENWEAKTAVTATGWSAEFRIPLRILRFSSRQVQSFGFQVQRYVSMLQELDEWAFIPRDVASVVSRYGRLDDLVGLRPEAPFELKPFIVGSFRHHDPSSTTLSRGYDPGFSAGLDLKWHISQRLTLDATFLPDFGQVEADQVVLNLTTFEQYYPEKRPFFLEGADVFNTPFQLLYTRRIGRAPLAPELRAGESLLSDPVPSTIYGAAKLVGELGHSWSLGEFVALTSRQTLQVSGQPAGESADRLVDPLTTYKVLRLKREIGRKSHVGLIAMATNRIDAGAGYPEVPGTEGRRVDALCPSGTSIAPGRSCFHDAYVAGLDGRWRSASGDYAASAQLIGTLIQGGPPRTLLDGTTIRSGDTGPALQAQLAKEGGKRWTARVEYEGYGRKVDYNDLGYMQRQAQHSVAVDAELRTLEPRGPTLETHTGISLRERDNLEGLNLLRSLSLGNTTHFKNFWGTYTELEWSPARFDDREMGDGAALERATLFGFEIDLFSDPRRLISGELWTQTHFIQNAGIDFEGEGRISVRALSQWDIDLLPSWIYTSGEPRYVDTQGGSYIFGRERAASASLTLRSTYTFTPQLTLQAYAQVFLESRHFTDFTSSPEAGRGSVAYLDRLRPFRGALDTQPDFQGGTLNASLVLRWEYRLGSTLYVVYTHAQNRAAPPLPSDGAGLNFRLVKPGAADDAVLLKLSYWWG